MLEIKPCDLLLVAGTSPLDRAIEDVTGSRWSHVAGFSQTARGQPEELVEAQSFRRVGYQDPGVYAGHSLVYRCDILTNKQRQRIARYVKAQIGDRYDYALIIVELVRYALGWVIPWDEGHTRICSTLWVDAYREAGIDLCPGIRWPTPGDIAQSELLRKVGVYS